MAEVSLLDALTMALAWELEHDTRVVILGEDVGVNGGVFRATAGLQQRFGDDRVYDTPLAEGMIAGVSIGMATQGMRPIAEIQFMGFLYPAIDQLTDFVQTRVMTSEDSKEGVKAFAKRSKVDWPGR